MRDLSRRAAGVGAGPAALPRAGGWWYSLPQPTSLRARPRLLPPPSASPALGFCTSGKYTLQGHGVL